MKEEIINKANAIIENHREIDKMMVIEMVDLVQGLLDLYKKEKEKNINLTQELEKRKWVKIKENGEVEPAFYISKDKIKAKIDYLLKRYDSEEDYCSYEVIISILQSLLEE